jgi:hypothetical protein
MRRLTIAVLCLVGCVFAPACQAIVGIEERGEATPIEDAGSGDAPSDGPPVLDPDAAPPAGCPVDCLPPAPIGWTGPSATYDGPAAEKPAGCPALYTQKLLDAHVGMTAAPATCTCGAAVTPGRRCDADVVTWVNAGCNLSPIPQGVASTTGACLVTADTMNAFYTVMPATLVPGTCTFPAASTTLPPAAFEKVQTVCGLPQTIACGDRADCTATPAPGAPYARVCIHKDGNVSCPSADYAQRFVAHKNVDDTRACTACSATPTGGSCGAQWGTSANQMQCASQVPFNRTVLTCYPYLGPGTHVNIGAMGPSAPTCTPSGGVATGVATSIEPVTFCCNR